MGKEDRKRVVQWDFDGVLCNSQTPIMECFKVRFGAEVEGVTLADWVTYEWVYEQAVVLSGEAPAAVAGWLFSLEVLGQSMPYPGAVAVSRWLDEQGMKQVVVTSRPSDQRELTVAQVEASFPWILADGVYLRGREDKGLGGDAFKLKKAQGLGSGLVVDDSGEVIRLLAKHGVQGLVLVDQRWNKDAELDRFRVARVGEVRGVGMKLFGLKDNRDESA